MKVCLVGLENLPVLAREFNHHGIGGEQVQQTLLARALTQRGYQVAMVTLDYGQPDGAEWHGVKVFKAYKNGAGIPVVRFIHPRWTGIWSALGRANADVYYTSCAGMQVGLVAMFCETHHRGLVFRIAHDTDADPKQLLIRYRRDKWLYAYGLQRTDRVLAQHRMQQKVLLKNYGVSSTVADMLVDPSEHDFDLNRRDVPVLWVNNLRDFKRPDLALDLARFMPGRTVHMVGGPQPGFQELYDASEDAAASLPNLVFHGRIPYHEIGDYFDRARVFVNTSDSEGFPNSYLQSWRRGVPVVAFFDPDALIAREGLGYAVSSMSEMIQAIERLLDDDAEWHAVSSRCRAYMERHHGDDVVLQPYIEALEHANEARRK